MAIRRVEFDKKLEHTRYDPDKRKWIGYRIDLRINGARVRERFSTQRKAEDFIDELKNKRKHSRRGLNYKSKSEIKLRDLIEMRIADYTPPRQLLVKRVLYYLLDITGEIFVSELTYQHLKKFNERRASDLTKRGTIVTESTIDREMTEISSMLKDAGEYFDDLEGYEPPKIPRLSLVDIRRERRIEDWEQIAIIAHFARPREPFESDRQYYDRIMIGHGFEFALLTSSRRKEVVKLKKTSWQPRADILKITRWKTIKAKKQSISTFSPVPDRVKEILELRTALNPESEYFFSDDGEDSYGYLKSLKLACKKLGIPYGRFTDGGLIFHDTRHTFVSTLIDSGIDLETARDLAGLSRDMILRYAHSSPEAKRRAVAVINRSSVSVREALAELFEKVRNNEVEIDDFTAEIFTLWSRSGHTNGNGGV